MVLVKPASANAFLNSPPAKISGVLLYGSDAEQIAARAETLISHKTDTEIIRLYENDLSSSCEKLAIELRTIPLFGGSKVISLAAVPASAQGDVIAITADPFADAFLVVQAPNLKKTSKLVQAFETSPHLAAIACYGEDSRDLRAYILAQLDREGCKIEPEALTLLLMLAGASQHSLRAELNKLVTYAGPQAVITVSDVSACCEDQTAAGYDDVINAALNGASAQALAALDRLAASGQNPVALLTILQSRILRLHGLSAAASRGEALSEAIKSLRPPVFFKQQDELIRQCRNLGTDVLQELCEGLSRALKETRVKPGLAEAIAGRAVLAVSSKAARSARQASLSSARELNAGRG